jgi:hypothetical protein
MKMTEIPDYETDPVSVICAPVSGQLLTRVSPWYTLKSIEAKPGFQKMKPAPARLKENARVAKSRAKARRKKNNMAV